MKQNCKPGAYYLLVKVALILIGRYPTDKAYGITTKNTVDSLIELGHQVFLFSFNPYIKLDEDANYNNIYFQENKFQKYMRRKFSANNKLFNKLFWKIYVSNYLEWVKEKCNGSNFDLIWMRNYETFKSMHNTNQKIILELHKKPNRKQLKFLIKNNKNLLLAPISKSISRSIGTLESKSIFSPMGVTNNQICPEANLNEYINKIKSKKSFEFVYVGKLYPGGVSKGVETIINIVKFAKESNIEMTMNVVGGDILELSKFRKLIESEKLINDITLFGQLPHEVAINFLNRADVILLTKSTDENYSGFPLKAVEALASARIILVEDSEAYRDVFGTDCCVIWFNNQNINRIFLELRKIIESVDLYKQLDQNRTAAKKLTWAERTKSLVNYKF